MPVVLLTWVFAQFLGLKVIKQALLKICVANNFQRCRSIFMGSLCNGRFELKISFSFGIKSKIKCIVLRIADGFISMIV